MFIIYCVAMVTVDVFLLHSLLIVSQITTYNRKPFNLKTNLLDRLRLARRSQMLKHRVGM
jgi:hypothetical protein